MYQVSLITLNQVAKLLIFIGIGYYICRSGKIPKESGHILSLLVTYLFAPAYILHHFAENLMWDTVAGRLSLLEFGVIATVLKIGIGCLAGKTFSRSQEEREALSYGFSFANVSYFGFPVIEHVLGASFLTDVMMFCVPDQMASYTLGYQMFDHQTRFSLRKLGNPFMLAMAVGAVIGLAGVELPEVLKEALQTFGNCMSPLSMLLVGMELSKISMNTLFTSLRAYGLALVRLAGIPAILGVGLILLGIRGDYLAVSLLSAAMPFGLNTVVFPENFNRDVTGNAQFCFVSYLGALITLPVLFSMITVLER